MPNFGERLLAVAIFLALEVPLAVIAYRVTRRVKPFLVPAVLLVAALVVPDPAWAALLLIAGLFTMFGQAIGARVRKTTEADRRHTVLILYLGRRRARWLEVLQVSTAFVAYGLAAAGEFSQDPGQRLAFRLLSFIPFGLHFLFVWIPIMKAQERPVLAETPFA